MFTLDPQPEASGSAMSLFEYVTVMISMILALSFGHLLTTISFLFRTGRPVKWHGPYSLWLACILLTLINHWWALWDFNAIEWDYAAFLYILIAPTLIAFAVGLLTLDRAGGDEVDLARHYARIRPLFLAVFFVYVLAMWFDGALLAGQNPTGPVGLLHVPMLAVITGAFASKRVWANVLAPLVVILTLLSIMAVRSLGVI
jgi:hypothetical protein